MWEVAIRPWHSSAVTWKGDDCFIQIVHSKPDFRGQCQIIVDILHHKAPGTLLKRCNSIGRLVNDLHAHQLNFPCSETELYDHLCRQRDAGAPSSRLNSLMEAIVFVRHGLVARVWTLLLKIGGAWELPVQRRGQPSNRHQR